MEIYGRVVPSILETAAPTTEVVDECTAVTSKKTQDLEPSPDPEEETSSSSMSPRPQRCGTQLSWKFLNDGFEFVTCTDCPNSWKLKLASLVGVTVEYQRGALASAALSSGEVGSVISGIRRFLLLARALGAEFDDHVPHLRALWRVHKSWVLTVPSGLSCACKFSCCSRRHCRFAPCRSPPARASVSPAVSLSLETNRGPNVQVVRPYGFQPRRMLALSSALLDWLVSENQRRDGWWCTRHANTSCSSVRGVANFIRRVTGNCPRTCPLSANLDPPS